MKAIEAGIVEMQQFYYRNLFGKTFLLNSPVVKVYHSSSFQWYTDHVPESNPNILHRDYVMENLGHR